MSSVPQRVSFSSWDSFPDICPPHPNDHAGREETPLGLGEMLPRCLAGSDTRWTCEFSLGRICQQLFPQGFPACRKLSQAAEDTVPVFPVGMLTPRAGLPSCHHTHTRLASLQPMFP